MQIRVSMRSLVEVLIATVIFTGCGGGEELDKQSANISGLDSTAFALDSTCHYRVTEDGVYVREKPGYTTRIGRKNRGADVYGPCIQQRSDGLSWTAINYNRAADGRGWIATRFINVIALP